MNLAIELGTGRAADAGINVEIHAAVVAVNRLVLWVGRSLVVVVIDALLLVV
jgi:hypothetical protein